MAIAKPLKGPPAHRMTVEEFVGMPEMVSEDLGRWNEEAFILYGPRREEYEIVRRDFYQAPPRRMWFIDRPKEIRERYSLALLKDNPIHAILIAQPVDAATGEALMEEGAVGEFYPDPFGNLLGIFESHRGLGVGPQFLAAAIEETGNVAPPSAYSPAGVRNRIRAHAILVKNALARGDKVPARVLEGYR
jgi:GNAT superfamily N-acetyltransferase